MTEDELISAVMRHRFKKQNAKMAVSRLGHLVDRDEHRKLRLLQPGMRMAEQLFASGQLSGPS
jgi:hypothetical protein